MEANLCKSDDVRPEQGSCRSNGCSHSFYCTVSNPALLLFLFPFFYHSLLLVTRLFRSTSIQVARRRQEGRGGASWVDGESLLSLSERRRRFFLSAAVEWTTPDRRKNRGRAWWAGLSPSPVTATPPPAPQHHSCRVSHRLYAICFAHCVHIYIDVRHIFLYTCTKDGISIL